MSDLGILIPLAAIGVGALSVWAKHQRSLAAMHLQATAEKAAQYATSNRDLEERVRVLERIVTDGGYDVAAQIEALRDVRAVEIRADPVRPRDNVVDWQAGDRRQ
jgi:hypothetical protein